MSKFTINPKSGLVTETKKVKFEITDLRNENGVRIKIENATHGVSVSIDGHPLGYVDLPPGITTLTGEIDLNVPAHSAQAAISVYAIVDNKLPNDTFEISAMLTSVYSVVDRAEQEFEGTVDIDRDFVGPTDRTVVSITYQPSSRIVLSVNDKRYSILTDTKGNGSIAINIEDVITEKHSPVLQKLPLRVFVAASHYTKPLGTGTYIHILPAKVALFASLTETGDCPPSFDSSPVQVDPIDPPQPFGIPNVTGPVTEKRTVEVLTALTGLNTVPDHSVAQTASGVAIHALVGSASGGSTAPQVIDPDLATDPLALATSTSVSKNVVYLVSNPSSLNKAVIKNDYGTIEPNVGNIILEVEKGVYDAASAGYRVGLMNAQFKFAYYTVSDLIAPSEYNVTYRLVLSANVEIDQFISCVPFVMVSSADPASTVGFSSPLTLPDIVTQFGQTAIPVKVAVATSPKKSYTNGVGYVYVIAEAIVGFASQLFYYAISMDGSESFGWHQLTSKGENKNPVAVCDDAGNLHIVSESTRAGSSQIYYGILGPSANSYANALFWGMMDKQASLNEGSNSFEIVPDPLFTELAAPKRIYTPLTCNHTAQNTMWIASKSNKGHAEAINDTEIHFSGNPVTDQALVWTLLDMDDNSVTLDSLFKQRSFALQFTIRDKQHRRVLSDEDIQNEFQAWLLNYVPESTKSLTNANVYLKNMNTFVIGRENRYFDRFIPLLGSYKHDDLKNMFADCVLEDDTTFSAILTGCNATVKHFMVGLMPEKVRWKATNRQTYSEFCATYSLNPATSQHAYLQDEEVVTYTGRYRLIVIMSGNNQYASNGGAPDFTVTRQIGDPFTLGPDDAYFQVIQNYRKMFREDVAHWFKADPANTSFDLARYIASMVIVQGKVPPDYHVPQIPNPPVVNPPKPPDPPPVYQPCGQINWTAERRGEPFYLNSGSGLGIPSGPFLLESPDYSIDFSNPAISQLVFSSDSQLDDILIMMPAGTHVVQTGGTSSGDPVSFTIPPKCILFTQNYGWFCNQSISVFNASVQKTITDGTNTAIIPLGTPTNDGHGDFRLFNRAAYDANPDPVFARPSAMFTIANFITGVSRTVLQANGFIDANGQIAFKFAHIVCGAGNAFIDSMTCGYVNPITHLARTGERLGAGPPVPAKQLLTWKTIFAQSILVDFCPNSDFGFNLAFGFPGGGQFISNEPQPYETSVFDYGNVDIIVRDIDIGAPHIDPNDNIVDMPQDAYNPGVMQVISSVNACESESFENTYGWLSMGLSEINIPQIPITLEGANQNPSIALGPVCNDIHIAWQSNRNDFWDIYYTMSNPTTNPFRFDTRITDSLSHSLMPKVAVDADGTRVVVWHENREDNQYQIFAAKGVGNSFCLCDQPKPKKNCVVDFNFCFFPCADYTSENPCDGHETFVT